MHPTGHAPMPRPVGRWSRLGVCAVLAALLAGLIPAGAPVSATTGPRPIVAQGQDEPATPPATTPSAAATQTVALSQFGYGDITVRGTRATIPITIPLRPGQALLDSSVVTLQYLLSPSLDPALSSITVSVNGAPRVSTALAATPGGSLPVVVPLEPTDRDLATASVLLTVEVVLAQAGVACPPADDPQHWLTIRAASTATLGLTNVDQSAGLADLPGLFTALTADRVGQDGSPQPVPVTIVVGQGAEAPEYRAAGYIAVALGRWARDSGVETSILVSDQLPADQPTIVVAAGPRFADALTWGDVSWNGTDWSTPSGLVAAGRGVLALQRTGTPRLLITSSTPAGVLDAASAVVEPGRAATLSGSWTVLTGRDVAPRDPRDPAWDQAAATFADLGASTYTLSGTGTLDRSLTFDRPAGWTIREGARLVLRYAVTGNIAPSAAMTVTLNGIGIGVLPLVAGTSEAVAVGAAGSTPLTQTAELPIPATVLNQPLPGESTRELRLDLSAELGSGTTCSGGPPPTVTLLPDSHWVLPHDRPDTLDLARFPAPLAGDPTAGVTPLLVVVPDWPSTGELQAAIRAIAAIGRWSAGDDRLMPTLINAGRVNPTDLDSANVVTIGSQGRNPLASQAAAGAGDALAGPLTISQQTVSPPATGQLALLPSPWRPGGVVLMLTGPIDAGVPIAGAALATGASLATLSGGVVTVGGSGAPAVLAAGKSIAEPAEGLRGRLGLSRWWLALGIAAAVSALLLAGSLVRPPRPTRTGQRE